MTRTASLLGVLASLLVTAVPTSAGIADDPVPPLQGHAAKLVYVVTEVALVSNANRIALAALDGLGDRLTAQGDLTTGKLVSTLSIPPINS